MKISKGCLKITLLHIRQRLWAHYAREPLETTPSNWSYAKDFEHTMSESCWKVRQTTPDFKNSVFTTPKLRQNFENYAEEIWRICQIFQSGPVALVHYYQ